MPTLLNIVVLEDHDTLRELTVAALQKHGHNVAGVYAAEDLDEIFSTRNIDVLILDLNLPGEDGLSVARRLKSAMPKLHIIVTTARGEIQDRVNGYESGADIYLPKPVSEQELVAAVANHARRLEQDGGQQASLKVDSLKLTLTGQQIVKLTHTELVLLKALAQAPDQRAENWRLLQATRRELDEKSKASLEVQIVNLRKKIVQVGYTDPSIRAIRGEGYQLVCPVQIT